MNFADPQRFIKTGFLGLLAACMTTPNVLLTPQAAFGFTSNPSKTETIRQTQALNEIQNSSSKPLMAEQPAVKQVAKASEPSYLISPIKNESNVNAFILIFLCGVLPTGVVFLRWRRKQRDRPQTLEAQIEMLERIWKKSPQYRRH
ncbi:hypothetical protein K9N68_19685 [Kovacikia minuta CCNUW1]|uniref:hypothetical protein n=1 Tax=Kovacikia minuta TaxID=2931930 RepID=UPI001CCCC2A5|nr:hypothetical protein [Kovacikia minuta]UBF23959.1 hypothetical protein K9N68_19685 [Kovacikia minuta CCNUW1]